MDAANLADLGVVSFFAEIYLSNLINVFAQFFLMYLSKLDAASLADLAVVSSFAEMATKVEGQEQVFTRLQMKR